LDRTPPSAARSPPPSPPRQHLRVDQRIDNGASPDVYATEGAFSIHVNLTHVGTYAFMASWLGNDDYAGAESGTAVVSSVQVQQKVTPEVVIGSSKYAVTIASGGSVTVTINGTVLPFEQTAVLLWVSDPQNSSTAIP
jgi:hypothetical protein